MKTGKCMPCSKVTLLVKGVETLNKKEEVFTFTCVIILQSHLRSGFPLLTGWFCNVQVSNTMTADFCHT